MGQYFDYYCIVALNDFDISLSVQRNKKDEKEESTNEKQGKKILCSFGCDVSLVRVGVHQ